MKKWGAINILLLLCFFLLAAVHHTFSQGIATPEQTACQYLEKGEVEKAIELLHKTLKSFPDNLNAHLYLGIAFYFKKDSEQAFKKFEKLEKELDRMVGGSGTFGDEAAFIDSGMERRAALLFSDEKKGLLSFFRGLTLKENNDLKSAEKKFKNALKLKYDKRAIRLQLFDLCSRTKDLKSAAEHLSELRKISADDELVVFLDGYLKYRGGSSDEALACFEKLAPANLEAKKNVARLHYNSADYQKAAEIWEEVLAAHPDSREALIDAGRSYFRLGNLEKAADYFQRANIAVPEQKQLPDKLPLVYETLLKDTKLDLMCK